MSDTFAQILEAESWMLLWCSGSYQVPFPPWGMSGDVWRLFFDCPDLVGGGVGGVLGGCYICYDAPDLRASQPRLI